MSYVLCRFFFFFNFKKKTVPKKRLVMVMGLSGVKFGL